VIELAAGCDIVMMKLSGILVEALPLMMRKERGERIPYNVRSVI
jgi:hypothetical protein